MAVQRIARHMRAEYYHGTKVTLLKKRVRFRCISPSRSWYPNDVLITCHHNCHNNIIIPIIYIMNINFIVIIRHQELTLGKTKSHPGSHFSSVGSNSFATISPKLAHLCKLTKYLNYNYLNSSDNNTDNNRK